MKIKTNDLVLVTKGKYRLKTGKVLKALPKEQRLIVEGVNLVKKHRRSRKESEKGKILEIPAPISIANVKLICKNCKKASRLGYRVVQGKKHRICKKCGKET